MRICLAVVLLSTFASLSEASQPEMLSLVEPTPATERLESFAKRMAAAGGSRVGNLEFDNIGPTVMSGRITDIEADPNDPTQMYISYASGGLWRSNNNGQSFEPLFDHEAAMTIGDIAVDWAGDNTIWVGTGENNSSRSSYAGTGLYKSSDGGESWVHMGLEESHRIGRILLHPDDPNTIWVAVVGALYSPSEHRGLYKSTDGGQSWRKTLHVSDRTGIIDLILDPSNPDILYAASWHRERRAWNFVEGGEDSGLWVSNDGGESWDRMEAEGLPQGSGLGRVGLAMHDSGVIYAFIDNQYRRPEDEEDDEPEGLTKEMLETMSREEFLALEQDDIAEYLEDNGFESRYTAESIAEMIESGDIEPIHLVWYTEDANRELFDTPVIGAEVYRSDDGGATWQKTHDDFLDAVYNSYGYYFGEIRVAPDDADRIYILGVPLLKSLDGGANWTSIGAPHVHVDHQAMWVNPNRPGHILNGNDGGLNITYDDGETWFKANSPSVGQFYAIGIDDANPYRVFGGLQDNGVWGGPHTYVHSYGWHGSGAYAYEGYLGGDGMQVEVDTRTNDLIYTGSQFGAYVRINESTGNRTRIRPRHTLGERPLRYNWQTPIHLSRHNQDVLYYGSNKMHRSFNRGDDWETLSEDLTRGGRRGDVPYGTLTTIDESPLRFGLLYTGSDDGLVHVSKDGGYTWIPIHDPNWGELWVSRVEASHHALGRVYVTLNGYRWDNFEAHVYRSDDFGETWTSFSDDLPHEPVNVILEDPANENVIYVGTDVGLYVSLDQGVTFESMQNTLPHVPVHDLKVQSRAQDLLVGTHGRSIYRADITQLQALTPEVLASSLHVFELESRRHSTFWGERRAVWTEYQEPSVQISFYAASAGEATIRILGEDDLELNVLTDEAEHGLNFVAYDLSITSDAAATLSESEEEALEASDNGAYYLPAGEYTVEITMGEDVVTTPLEIVDRS